MMKRLLVIIYLLAFLSFNLLCQSDKLDCSIASFSFKNAQDLVSVNSFVGFDESGVFVVGKKPIGAQKNNYDVYLQHFDKNLTLIGMKNLVFQEQDSKMFNFGTILNFNNRLFALYSINDKESGKSSLYYQSIDEKRLSLNADSKKIAELDLSAHKKSDQNQFNLFLSPDSSKLLIYNFANHGNDVNETIEVKVFDDVFSEMSEFELLFNYGKSDIIIRQVVCDNYGNVAVLAVTAVGYVIQYYNSDGTFVHETAISNSTQNLSESSIRFENNQIVFFSFITNQQTLNVKGFYYFILNPATGNFITKNISEFPKEFIYKNLLKGEVKVIEKDEEREQSADLMKFNVKHMIRRSDNGHIIIAEQVYLEKSSSSSAGSGPSTSSATTIYYCNDIIVISLSPDGTTEWQNKIGKRQREIASDDFENSLFVSPLRNWSSANLDPQKFLSYTYAYFEDELFLFYNDHEKNSSLNYETIPVTCLGKHNSTVFSCVNIDKSGNMKKTNLFNCKEAKFYPIPANSIHISNSDYLFFGLDGDAKRFMKMELK